MFILTETQIYKFKLMVSVDFKLRFEDLRCTDGIIWKGYDVNCRDRCESDDKCKYVSQWLQTSTYCEMFKSCTTQRDDRNKDCAVDSKGNRCPIKTFEKISTSLHDLVNLFLMI